MTADDSSEPRTDYRKSDRRPSHSRDDRRDYGGKGRRDYGKGPHGDVDRPRGNGHGKNFHKDGKGPRKGKDSHGDRKDFHNGRDGHRNGKDFRRGGDRPREAPQEFKLTIPSTPEKILFKGIDCEVNGRSDLAMYLYLHGAMQLSGGCESNALRMLREMGKKEFKTVRGRVAKNCPEDALIAYDYLCSTLDDEYDRSFLVSSSETGNPLAIFDRIRLEDIDGEDPIIDTFAASDDERMVEEGLKLLVRKKDSEKAAKRLAELNDRRRLRQTVRPTFIRAVKGDRQSVRELEDLSTTFPEAGFLRGYLDAEDREQYIRDGMSKFKPMILSVIPQLGLSDTAYGKFLAAKKLQTDGEEWIPKMLDAVAAGSQDAQAELVPVQTRKDVRRALSSIHLSNGDAVGLVRCYDGEDTTFLDKYCSGSAVRTLEVARIMGGARGIDWLKKGCLDGLEDCRTELVSMARSGEHQSKQLVYALHDIGEELEAAKLYFAMYGDKSLPSVKWLAKVCADEEAKEFVRSRFEEMGDMATFDSIFEDDGYNRKRAPKGRGRRQN